VRHSFETPFNTEQVDIRPKTWNGNAGLRIELFGCPLGKYQFICFTVVFMCALYHTETAALC